MAEACSAFDIPVVGGNVSLYNASRGSDIDPSPVVGLLGEWTYGIYTILFAVAIGGERVALVFLDDAIVQTLDGNKIAAHVYPRYRRWLAALLLLCVVVWALYVLMMMPVYLHPNSA